MPKMRPGTVRKPKAAMVRSFGRPAKPGSKHTAKRRRDSTEMASTRAEVEAAIAEARKSHERLREAIDILPQGIVFLDADGRYILWNKKYAEIYNRSSDQFKPGARLADTIRIGVERGDYPEAIGREEEWIAERLTKLLSARRTARADSGRRPRHPDRRAVDRGRRRHRPARRYHRIETARGVVPAAVRLAIRCR